MLKNFHAIALAFLSVGLASGCAKKASSALLCGLVPGTYHYQSSEGVMPEGWSFDATSFFEFQILGEDSDYDRDSKLEAGRWRMPYYPLSDDGSFDYTKLNHNCAMVWSNTPFDALSSLDMSFHYKTADNVAVMGTGDTNSDWSDFLYNGTVCVECLISGAEPGNYSKRKLTVQISHLPEICGGGMLRIGFSM